jgi:serine/arginine repetitive matrix protein 2
MFGGVGIPSAKGTGTNGYVERALGYLPKDYKPGSYGEIIRQMKSNPAPIKRKINDEIILHEEKHKVEVELYDLREKYLKEKKYSAKEIEEKINRERKRLYHLLERREADFMDKNETHQKGKLKDAQMKIIKDALKIKDDYYLGEGFEYGLQADENKRKKKSKKEHKSKKDDKKIKKHHKDEHKRRHESKKSEDEGTDKKYSNDDSYDERDYERRRERYRRVYRDNISRSPSQSRSRSRSKSYNRNIKKALNSDYRLNKKYKLTESVFKRSPSPVINDKEKGEKEEKDKEINEQDNKKIEKEDKNEKNKIEKEIKNNNDINNNNKEKNVKNDEETQNKNSNEKDNNEKKENEVQESKEKIDDEHEEGSINE